MFRKKSTAPTPKKFNIKLTPEELKFINDLIKNTENASVFSKKQTYGDQKPRLTVLITEDKRVFLVGDGKSKKQNLTEGLFKLEKTALLGEGAFGRAKAAALLSGEPGQVDISDKVFAVKIVNLNKANAKKEADFFKKANGYAEYIDGGKTGPGYIIEEFVPGVELAKLHFENPITSLEQCSDIMIAIVREIARLHQLNICHGDGGTNNIKYDELTKSARFVDFGLTYEGNERRINEDAAIESCVLIFRWFLEGLPQLTMRDFSFDYMAGVLASIYKQIKSFIDPKTGQIIINDERIKQLQAVIHNEYNNVLMLNENEITKSINAYPEKNREVKLEILLNKCFKTNDIDTFKKIIPYFKKEILLRRALESKKSEFINTMLEFNDIELDQANSNFQTPLFLAIKQGNVVVVKRLIELKANVDQHCLDEKDRFNYITPLHLACEAKQLAITEALIENGARIDMRDSNYENTALHHTIVSCDPLTDRTAAINIIKKLIQSGAPINGLNGNKKSPLYLAVELGFLDIAKVLLAMGAKPTPEISQLNDTKDFRNLFDCVQVLTQAHQVERKTGQNIGGFFELPNLDSLYEQACDKDYDYFTKYYVPATIDRLSKDNHKALGRFLESSSVRQIPGLKKLINSLNKEVEIETSKRYQKR